MNFIEYYEHNRQEKLRGNYIIEAPEGFGKTTILKGMYNRYKEQLTMGTGNIIPIYIRLADINVKSREDLIDGIILEFVREQFYSSDEYGIIKTSIQTMIRDNSQYKFLFLLDGLNEVINRELEMGGCCVLDVLNNDFKKRCSDDKCFFDYPNVDIVVTTRKSSYIKEELLEKQADHEHRYFRVVKLEKLHLDVHSVNSELLELLDTPMLAGMYKQISKEDLKKDKLNIKTKYELLNCFYNLEMVIDHNFQLTDARDKRIKIVLDDILPLIALKIEAAMLHYIADDGKLYREMCQRGLNSLVEDIIDENGFEVQSSWVTGMVEMLNVVDQTLQFSHDMIREYWAIRGVNWCIRYADNIFYAKDENDVLQMFITDLIRFTYRKERYEPIRQTLHLGLLETLFSANKGILFDSKLEQAVIEIDQKSYKRILFYLYYNYSSILDDENEREQAAKYAWQAYEYMLDNKDIIEMESMYQRANIYNSLGYCVNNYKMETHTGEQTLEILKQADHFVEICLNDKEVRKKSDVYRKAVVLKGKILNNIGACYYGAYYGAKYCDQALEWHQRSKKYREEHEANVSASYRVIASDYFKMSQYDKSYMIYKEFLQYSVQGDNLVDRETFEKLVDYSKKNSDVIVIVINAIGAECKWLQKCREENKIDEYQDAILKEIPSQLRFCIMVANRGSRRKAIDIIEKIEQRIQQIQGVIEFFGENERKEIASVICAVEDNR